MRSWYILFFSRYLQINLDARDFYVTNMIFLCVFISGKLNSSKSIIGFIGITVWIQMSCALMVNVRYGAPRCIILENVEI